MHFKRLILVSLSITLAPATSVAWDHTVGANSKCAGVPHISAPDVAYQPGVDTQGWAVAPADLSPPPLSSEDVQNPQANLDVPLGKYLKHPEKHGADLSETNLAIGTLKVEGDTVTLNGKDLKPEEPLDAECEK